ncbi:6090_t:CDS:1, partial [Rhizophagus irregularis]
GFQNTVVDSVISAAIPETETLPKVKIQAEIVWPALYILARI